MSTSSGSGVAVPDNARGVGAGDGWTKKCSAVVRILIKLCMPHRRKCRCADRRQQRLAGSYGRTYRVHLSGFHLDLWEGRLAVPKSVAVGKHRFSLRDALCGDVPSAVRATRRQGQGRQRMSQPCLRGWATRNGRGRIVYLEVSCELEGRDVIGETTSANVEGTQGLAPNRQASPDQTHFALRLPWMHFV